MTNAPSDHDLLRRVATSDGSALQVLYGRHNVRIYRFIARTVKNDAIAEELTNEVFIDVWRNAGKFEGRSQATTWLYAIARNKAISSLRRRRDEELDDETAAAIPDMDDTPEVTAQKTDKRSIIRDCLAHLSDEHREVIDLVYYHEKSVREVSEITDTPEATVKTRMYYARKALSEILLDAGVERGWP